MDRDRRLAILGGADPASVEFRAAIPHGDFERSYQLLLPDGRRLQSGPASVELMELLRPTRWLGLVARRLRLTVVVGLLYNLVSVHRSRLGRLVPDRPGPHRPP